jgi:hypothetical protein
MKRALSISVVVCLFLVPLHLLASASLINSSGQPLLSIFDGLKPNPIPQSALRGALQSPSFDLAHLSSRLSGVPRGFFIIGGGNCPGGGLCSGGFAHTITTFPGECNQADDEQACDINDFVNSSSDLCSAGIEQSYCGSLCCVTANHCENPRNCAGPQ